MGCDDGCMFPINFSSKKGGFQGATGEDWTKIVAHKHCTQQLDRTGQRECGCLLADGSPRLRGREKEFKFGNEGIQLGEEVATEELIGEEVFHCFTVLQKSADYH